MANGKLIAKWSDSCKVGIWDNETWTVRLYEDRAVYRHPYVKWVGQSGSLAYLSHRITGKMLTELLEIAKQQVNDSADYTNRVGELTARYDSMGY